MVTIIYAYRNREISRIKKSLDSLIVQSNQNFNVELVDYGSDIKHSLEVQKLVSNYTFLNYTYYYTINQPWSKAKALNSIIKNLQTTFCFIADIDMIFSPKLIEKLIFLQEVNSAIYFKVGYLNKSETSQNKKFNEYIVSHFGNEETTGMTMFSVKSLQDVRGYDEFYHFWGSEDTDLHVRMRNYGIAVKYYDADVLMLHQWHESYMKREQTRLVKELQLNTVIQINYQHLIFAKKLKKTIVNDQKWGKIPGKQDFALLNDIVDIIEVSNQKEKIDDLLFGQLPTLVKNGIKIVITSDDFQNTLRYKLKKVLGKKVPNYYTLKQINDKFLLHIISFYRDLPYDYHISDDLKKITFTIKCNVHNEIY